MSATPTSASGTWVVSRRRPSSPPVTSLLRRISTEPAWAKARVTIAKEMPPTRSPIAPEHERDDRAAEQGEQHRRHQAQVGALQHDAQPVGADGQVERVAEAQQPGHPEDHVVGQRQRGEDQRERHQLQRAGRVRRSRQHAGHAQVDQRQHREQHDEAEHAEQPQRQAATPRGRGARPGPRAAAYRGVVPRVASEVVVLVSVLMRGLPSGRRGGRAARWRAAARPPGRRSRRGRSWPAAGAPRPPPRRSRRRAGSPGRR